MKKILLLAFLQICISCSEYKSEINTALESAGENKKELLKVLEYYKNQKNTEKLKAAEFLIENLPYNYAYDTTNLYKYRVVSAVADSMLKKKKNAWIEPVLNKLWDSLKVHERPYRNIYSKPIEEDVKKIKSDFLIDNIESAYKSWKTNPYAKDSVSFQDFCEYVLPYRLAQGKSIENWRSFFQQENKHHFIDSYPIPFTKACDSLFVQYKNYRFNYWIAQGLPLLKFKDFMKIRQGKCTVKSWLNTYIVAAEGIPMAIDFVPAWGNKEDNHEWNSLIYGGKTIYFESYWEPNNNWNYNPRIYNNQFEDDTSGKIRLPKIFRHTFSTNMEGPISDKRVQSDNIPPLFRNVKKKDVSDQYFKTVDVEVELTSKALKNSYYAYLGVQSPTKRWVLVQWGKIINNKATFKKMGKDILYQPFIYKNGRSIPCGVPFHIKQDGAIVKFEVTQSTYDVVIKRKYPPKKGLIKDAKLLKGAVIQASNEKSFANAIVLGEIDFEPELRPYEFPIQTTKKYRYYRVLSKKKITINQIDLFQRNSNKEDMKLEGKFISSAPLKESDFTWKGVDLGSSKLLTKIKIAPRNNRNHVFKNLEYELFYLDQGVFVSLGKKKATSFDLKFKNVPKNALLYLECLSTGRQERLFYYKDGKQDWF